MMQTGVRKEGHRQSETLPHVNPGPGGGGPSACAMPVHPCLVTPRGGGGQFGAPADPPTHPHQKNEIYQRGRKFGADFRYTNFFLASDPGGLVPTKQRPDPCVHIMATCQTPQAQPQPQSQAGPVNSAQLVADRQQLAFN